MSRKGVLIGLAAAWLVAGMQTGQTGGVAEAAVSSGFAVSPAFEQVDIPADRPQVVHYIQVVNHNPADQEFALSVVDFGSLDEEGGVAFLGTPATELAHKYGLASWLKLPQTTITVPAGKALKVQVTVENRPSLAPGGHYGALLATALTQGASSSDSVGVKQVLSSLILVTKSGGLRQELNLESNTFGSSWWKLPGKVVQRFHNTGNVHLVPRGVISVIDPLGKEVERVAINEDSKVVLPDTYRKYSAKLMSVARGFWPGHYRLVTSYRYDGSGSLKTYEQSFWYAGAVVLWVVFAAAVAAALALAWWLWGRPRRNRRKKR